MIVRFWLLHWRGQCSLAVTFWLNFVALSAAAYVIQQCTHGALADRPTLLFCVLSAQFVGFRLFFYPRQL